ncbi:MAG: sigma-E factor negative regulatory protein [Rubrivivax sp.]|nr:sigma-E factor negative regulatory protein [Rubrivivax sp.]
MAEPPAEDLRRCLSALADGEASALARACSSWRDDAAARETWHAYHLIGDVLRSEDLAHPPARDEAFLAGLRQRLAAEPAILAPAPVRPAAPARTRQTWLMPAAVAAGFVVVAGVLVVTRTSQPGAQVATPTLAAASSPGVLRVGNAAAVATPLPSGGNLIRDLRLDEYLRAHQAARDGVAVAAPGGGLRQVEVLVPAGGPR